MQDNEIINFKRECMQGAFDDGAHGEIFRYGISRIYDLSIIEGVSMTIQEIMALFIMCRREYLMGMLD